jgi:hypothetical protein
MKARIQQIEQAIATYSNNLTAAQVANLWNERLLLIKSL